MIILTEISAAFVVLTVVHTIALSSSLYRFHHRFTHNIEYGLDDVFATIATIGDLFMLGVFTSTGERGPHLSLTCLNL